MADENLLRELLSSPLEDKVGRRVGDPPPDADADRGAPTPSRSWGRLGSREVGLFAVAALLGVVIVLVVRAMASDDGAPVKEATTAVDATTTPATAAGGEQPPPEGLPPGYEQVDTRLGMRVERILQREDGVFVTITTVTHNSLDPEGTTGFQGGLWALVLEDGTRVETTVDGMDDLARGVVTVVFPPGDYGAGDIASVELAGMAHRTTVALTASSPAVEALPEDGSAVTLAVTPNRFEIDAGVAVVLGDLTLSTTRGEIEWSLEATVPAAATISPALRLRRADETDTAFTTRVQTSSQAFFHPSVPAPILGDAGVGVFEPAEGGATAAAPGFTAELSLEVTWAVYTPASATLPVGDAVIAVVG